MIYSFMWLTVFGGGGIRLEREAAKAGLCCPNFNFTENSILLANKDDVVSIYQVLVY